MMPGHTGSCKPEHFSLRNYCAETEKASEQALDKYDPLNLLQRDDIFHLGPYPSGNDHDIPCQGIVQGTAKSLVSHNYHSGSDDAEWLDQVRHPLENREQVSGG